VIGSRIWPPSTYSRVGSTARGPRSAFSPIALEGASTLILRLVDLAVRMQPSQRIVAERAQRDDLLAGVKRQRIVDLDGRDFGVAQQIPRPPVMRLGGIVGLFAFGFRHIWRSPFENEIRMQSENLRYAVSTIRNQMALSLASRSGAATGLRLKSKCGAQ
jgi:hypothetical protein